MSLIKLAILNGPIVLAVPQQDPNANSSRALNARNIAAVAAGATTGYAGSELLERKLIKNFNKSNLMHKYFSRMGGATTGLLGAATAYKIIKPKKQDTTPRLYVL